MNIVIKIITFIITSGIVGGISIFLFGVMIITMNGYSESDAQYGIFLYMIWAVVGSLLAGLISILAAQFLVNKKQVGVAIATIISIIVFVIVGVIINFIGVVAGIATAEVVRTQF